MGPRPSRRQLFHLATFLVVGIVVWHVTSTYTVLSHTADEPLHVAVGVKYLEEGTYHLQAENPPLATVGAALGSYLAGHRLGDTGTPHQRGVEVLYAEGTYWSNLIGARLGALPFFLLAIVLVWLWAYRSGGGRAAFLASTAFCTLPPVMGHAGLATTDTAFVATFLLTIFALVRWFESPTIRRSLFLGFALGLAVTAKFSTLVFFPPCVLAVLVVRLVWRRRGGNTTERNRWRQWLLGAAIVVVVSPFVVWSVYGFSVGKLADTPGAHRVIEKCFPEEGSHARRLAEWIFHVPSPAPDCLFGLFTVLAHAARGQPAYLLGQKRQRGFRHFYPVVLSVKTPFAFFLLLLAGLITVGRRVRELGWQSLAPAAVAVAIVVAAIPSTINLGVRHILAVYPLFAITIGIGIDALIRRTAGRRGQVVTALVGLVLGWQLLLVFLVYPNYLAYFNALASREPGSVSVDSDLDWGQDFFQLEAFFEDRDVELVHIAYFGSVRLCSHDMPPLRWLEPGKPVTGWIAISEMYYREQWRITYPDPCDRKRGRVYRPPGGYAWLHKHEPVAIAGRSIRIYHIPDE